MTNQRTPRTDYTLYRDRASAALATIKEQMIALDARMNAVEDCLGDDLPADADWKIAGQMQCMARLLEEAAGE